MLSAIFSGILNPTEGGCHEAETVFGGADSLTCDHCGSMQNGFGVCSYARLGFLEYGVEKNALKQAGRYYDEVLMAKDLLRQSN
jgi:hypothetical protein